MTQIRVLDLAGPICVDPDDGSKLCGECHAAFAKESSVLLDFTGVRTVTSSFLNAAVGCLFSDHPVAIVRERLRWTGLDPTDEKLVELVLDNAARFYSATDEQQQAMAAAWHRVMED